jgi:hypothetical protein
MSNDKVRPDGWYLGRWGEHSSLVICYIHNNTVADITDMGSFYNPNSYHWIADEPLDLESIRSIHEANYACTCNDGEGVRYE